MKTSRILAALCATATCAATIANAAVKSSVFDDVKVWYKGSAGNAIGTADSSTVTKVKNLPQLSDTSSSMHGGDYGWWGWRLQYKNQKVDCPYAGVTLDSTPCMVVPSYAAKTGDATVTINGETTTQPYWTARRFGNLYFTNWMSDWASGTVCSNWTCVLRFRSDQVNQVSGNANHIIDIGSSWNGTAGAATGVALNLNTPTALADYACPRTFVTTTQKNYINEIQIKNGRWVDCALVVNGQTLTMWFCWNNGTDEAPENKLVKITETYPTTAGLPTIPAGCRVNLASQKDAYSATFTNGVYNSEMSNKAFEGAFHQIAFWDRTLSDDEIREAMAGGTGRPNLVDVGMEGNGINEFAAAPTVASAATTGAWENLDPTLTAQNPSATISFDCPALWAGMPQWLRIAGAGAGRVSVTLNNEALGTKSIGAGRATSFFVPEGKIVSGTNTLVITRTDGSPVLDAVRLGGSWKFGESVTSFNSASVGSSLAAKLGSDCWIFHAACGNDKLHARGTTWSINGDNLSFPFFVPADMVGKFRGILTFKSATAGSTPVFKWLVNGADVCDDTGVSGNTDYPTKVSVKAFTAGWNEAVWHRTTGWINFNSFQFTVLDAPQPFLFVVH